MVRIGSVERDVVGLHAIFPVIGIEQVIWLIAAPVSTFSVVYVLSTLDAAIGGGLASFVVFWIALWRRAPARFSIIDTDQRTNAEIIKALAECGLEDKGEQGNTRSFGRDSHPVFRLGPEIIRLIRQNRIVTVSGPSDTISRVHNKLQQNLA